MAQKLAELLGCRVLRSEGREQLIGRRFEACRASKSPKNVAFGFKESEENQESHGFPWIFHAFHPFSQGLGGLGSCLRLVWAEVSCGARRSQAETAHEGHEGLRKEGRDLEFSGLRWDFHGFPAKLDHKHPAGFFTGRRFV